MTSLKRSVQDMYACALMVDLEQYKEGLRNERKSKIAETIEPVRHFLPD